MTDGRRGVCMCLWTQEKVSDSEHDCMGAGSLFFCCFFHVNCNQWPWGCRRHPSKWQPNQNTRPCKKAPVVAPLSIGLLLCLAICFMITAVCYNLCPEGIYLSGAECQEMSRCPDQNVHIYGTLFSCESGWFHFISCSMAQWPISQTSQRGHFGS